MPGLPAVATMALFFSLAVTCDIRKRTIPNVLNACGLVSGLALSAVFGGGRGLLASGLGALLGCGVMLAPFLLRMVGGGDLKFLAAAGSFTGCSLLWWGFLAGSALAGAAALVILLSCDRSLERLGARALAVFSGPWRPCSPGTRATKTSSPMMPYAVPLAAGILLVSCIHLLG